MHKRASILRWIFLLVAMTILGGAIGGYAFIRAGSASPLVPIAHPKLDIGLAFPQDSANPPPVITGAILRNAPTALFPRLAPGSLYSNAIKAQNALPGTSSWRITGPQTPGQIEGFADSTYASIGQSVPIYVSTVSSSFHIIAYRMGWYQGLLGRRIWSSLKIRGVLQPKCLFLAVSNTTECSNWSMSYRVEITKNFIPGDYLFKLIGNKNQQQYVPITIVDPNSNAAIAIMNSVTTWQAYNSYGGYSLYHGPGYQYGVRATKVSFDRPYSYGFGLGSGDFLGNELPLVALAERLGLNVTYINSIYLQRHPNLVANHNAIVSLGHDEYYSTVMRSALTGGIDAGHSLIFLGANAIYRRIRLDSSPLGNDRIEVNYRNPYLDPLFGKDNANVTANWPSYPDPNDESALIGLQYACNPVNAPMIITDPSSWIFAHTKVKFGASIPHLIGSEFDEFSPFAPHPRNIQLLAHSPLICRNQPYYSDMSYYSTPEGGGVFATGTNYWVVSLISGCPPFTGLCPDPITDQITSNVLEAFGTGNVGILHPSIPNALSVYYHPPSKPVVARPILNHVTPTTSALVSPTTSTSQAITTTTFPTASTSTTLSTSVGATTSTVASSTSTTPSTI